MKSSKQTVFIFKNMSAEYATLAALLKPSDGPLVQGNVAS
jgi:hypothetical protein